MARFGYLLAARVCLSAAAMLLITSALLLAPAEVLAYGGYTGDCTVESDGCKANFNCNICGTLENGCPCER